MSDIASDPISGSVDTDDKSLSSVNGRENIVESIKASKIKDWGRRAVDDEVDHGSDLRRNVRRETGLNTEESEALRNKRLSLLSHDRAIGTARFEEGSRRNSEVQLLPKDMLATLPQTRRKSTSEVERHNGSTSNLKPTLASQEIVSDAWMSGEFVCNDTSSTASKHSSGDSERFSETLTFPALSRVNVRGKFELSSSGPTHCKESKGIQLHSEHHGIYARTEHLTDAKGHFGNQDFAQKLLLPAPEKGESTRRRSLSDSQVVENSTMSAEQREKQEKLDRLKRQIYETNLKKKNKNCRKMSGSNGNSKQSTGYMAAGKSIFPVLTEKSLKRHSKSHEMGRYWAPTESLSAITATDTDKTLSDPNTNTSDTSFAADNANTIVDSAGHMVGTDLDRRDTSLNTELSSELPPMPPALAYSTDNHQVKRESNRLHFPTPLNSEGDSSESISVIIERLRARSEPGDVATRKLSSAEQFQLQSRARSETDALKVKVQSFVERPLPALPPSTLRVKRSALNQVPAKSGHFKSGVNALITPEPREKKEGVINIHNCPNLNLFSDQSWMYQDKSRKKHRYIRGPATPVPSVDFVFGKRSPDSS